MTTKFQKIKAELDAAIATFEPADQDANTTAQNLRGLEKRWDVAESELLQAWATLKNPTIETQIAEIRIMEGRFVAPNREEDFAVKNHEVIARSLRDLKKLTCWDASQSELFEACEILNIDPETSPRDIAHHAKGARALSATPYSIGDRVRVEPAYRMGGHAHWDQWTGKVGFVVGMSAADRDVWLNCTGSPHFFFEELTFIHISRLSPVDPPS